MDQLLSKAEEEVARSEERRFSSQSHRKSGRFHPYASNDKPSHQQDQKIGSKYVNASRERKVMASLPLFHRNRPRILSNVMTITVYL